jgi:putative nucleotidyltransferase with HDIG domain
MAARRLFLLITDRPCRSRDRAAQLALLGACRTIALHDRRTDVGLVAAIVTDVGLDNPSDIGLLRDMLSARGSSTTPVLALLRNNTRLARVQAIALGTTATLDASASDIELTSRLRQLLGLPSSSIEAAADAAVRQRAGQTREVLAGVFAAVARDRAVDMSSIAAGVESVTSAIEDGGIRNWLDVVWTYDDRIYQHCLLVAGLAGEFGASLGFTRDDQDRLVKAALLHDLGKAKIPLALVNKKGALAPEEAALMRTHPTIGYEILRLQGDCDPKTLDVVLHHHELLDGSGYPDRLAGAAIGDLVRLVTICDVFAALVERRSYKPAFTVKRAFQILRSMEGKLEDPLVLAFEEVIVRVTENDEPPEPGAAERPIAAGGEGIGWDGRTEA